MNEAPVIYRFFATMTNGQYHHLNATTEDIESGKFLAVRDTDYPTTETLVNLSQIVHLRVMGMHTASCITHEDSRLCDCGC